MVRGFPHPPNQPTYTFILLDFYLSTLSFSFLDSKLSTLLVAFLDSKFSTQWQLASPAI